MLWTGFGSYRIFYFAYFQPALAYFHGWISKPEMQSSPARKAYWSYIAATYYLNQLGFSREQMSPAQFAKEKIDPYFKTNFASFMQVYLKSKYSKEALTLQKKIIAQNFYQPVL